MTEKEFDLEYITQLELDIRGIDWRPFFCPKCGSSLGGRPLLSYVHRISIPPGERYQYWIVWKVLCNTCNSMLAITGEKLREAQEELAMFDDYLKQYQEARKDDQETPQ